MVIKSIHTYLSKIIHVLVRKTKLLSTSDQMKTKSQYSHLERAIWEPHNLRWNLVYFPKKVHQISSERRKLGESTIAI